MERPRNEADVPGFELDVAQAFVFAARVHATTGAVITVDGWNVAAMVR